jgi:ATP-dependent DNA helicase RecG
MRHNSFTAGVKIMQNIDFDNLAQYRENNQFEVKSAESGLPQSLWETYSAFANTSGGSLILGIKENKDHSLTVTGITGQERLLKEFRDTINNRKKVNVNILTDDMVSVEETAGKNVICVSVPRANRTAKPVYIGSDIFSGTFRRNGEGDYHCTREEITNMLRDQSAVSQDSKLLVEMNTDVFDPEAVQRYRIVFSNVRPGHVWTTLADELFLEKIGAASHSGENGKLHPTGAGLLMFGFEYTIVREYGSYFLDYREELSPDTRWTDRVISSSGDWSGNIFDFFFRIYSKLVAGIKIPFKLEQEIRIDDTPVHKAIREALANALIHANYYGRRGIVIIKKQNSISISNPGTLRIAPEEAISGGISDPRNSILIKMFNLINIGERAGSGLPGIFSVWKQNGWETPELNESFDPDRMELLIPLPEEDKKVTQKVTQKVTVNQKQILAELQRNPFITQKELADIIGISKVHVNKNMMRLQEMNLIRRVGPDKTGHWEILK